MPVGFHFHAPSDHTFHEKYFELELHIVHVDKHTKELGAVLAVIFDRKEGGSRTNKFIASLSPELIGEEGEFTVVDTEYNTGYYETEH